MKKIYIYLLLITILCFSGCTSKDTPLVQTTIETTQSTQTEENISFDFIKKIQEKENYLKNKEEETASYVMYMYDGSSFNTNIFPVPEKDKYIILAQKLSTEIGLENILPLSIEKKDNKIIIDLDKEHIAFFNQNLKQEIIFLESYSKTFSENLGGLVYFTVNNKNYESEHMYFGTEEYYPITTGLF